MSKERIELFCDDYAQSANTLFHFMKEFEYLEDILMRKAIMPRYCKENLEYLKIADAENNFSEVYVLQKCFCDIPFHKLTESFQLQAVGENYQKLNDAERMRLPTNYTHPDFYGEYAIAFSKGWGEKNNLQPISYLNEQSQYAKALSKLVNEILNAEDVPDVYADDILNRLCFVKPLRGTMKRKFKCDDNTEVEIEFLKNFHDEQEWRYVPPIEVAKRLQSPTTKLAKVYSSLRPEGVMTSVLACLTALFTELTVELMACSSPSRTKLTDKGLPPFTVRMASSMILLSF